MKKNNCFVIVVTYNGASYIQECLDSCIDFEVIVVDNASTDNTCEIIERNFPRVMILKNEKNTGFGQANNLGIRHALDLGADFVFLLNQDAFIENDCINILILKYSENTNYGILSPVHLNGAGNKLDRNFSYYMSYDKNEFFYSDFILKNENTDIYDVPFVNAAAWLLPRATLKLIGGFDPIFFHYGEDDNYCQKVRYEKLNIGVVRDAFVRHDRENIVKRPQKNRDDFLKYFRTMTLLKYSNINSKSNYDYSVFRIWLKTIYNLIFTTKANYLLERKKVNIRKSCFDIGAKSILKYKSRKDYLYL